MLKRRKSHMQEGICKKLLCENKNKKNSLIKKNVKKCKQYQHFSNFEKIEFINKHCKRCNIFMNNKVFKAVPYYISTILYSSE